MLDVIDADVITKNVTGVAVIQFDRGSGKTDKGGIGQRIAHVASKAGDEAVLAAVGFIGDDYNIFALGKQFVLPAFFLGKEFLGGGKNYAT